MYSEEDISCEASSMYSDTSNISNRNYILTDHVLSAPDKSVSSAIVVKNMEINNKRIFIICNLFL